MLIFDCDGVLVDSEVLVTDVHVGALRRLGLNITHAQLVERFLGVTDHSMYAVLEVELGRPLPEDYDQQVSEEVYRRSARELRAVTGAAAAIRRIRGPVCVASSSSREMLDYKLSVTGLVRLFGAAIFSADAVTRGKPAPDIFQYAAREMGIAAAECLVVEDSENGVKAAVAAGMEVIGFTGGSHLSRSHGACLIDAGARAVAEDFAALMQLAPERFR